MINNFKNIDFKTSENSIHAVFKIKFDFEIISKSFLYVFITIALFSSLAYFNNDLIIRIVETTLVFTSIIIIISIFQKEKITIRPFLCEATIKTSSKDKKISWPPEYILDHEINFTSQGKLIDVTLFAYCPNSNKSILIFSFVDLKTFELFQKEYNLSFPSQRIH